MAEKKLFPCFVCKNNGFPDEMVILAGRDDEGNSIRKNPDESPHTHKTKLAKRNYTLTQQVPMTQPLSREKTKEEAIQSMHDENKEGYAEYRKILKEQVDATRFLAEAILELARAMRQDKGAVQTEEGRF